jgi:gliding motility-associated-like protein
VLSPGSYSQYLWQDLTTQPTYVVTKPGTYWVTVTDSTDCVTSDTVVVKFAGCFAGKIPNTFTPNGDGINDTWNINGLVEFPQCTVFIYSRWGQQVFSSTGYSRPWDGTYGSKLVAMGVYYYIISLGNNSPPLSGFVTVIR